MRLAIVLGLFFAVSAQSAPVEAPPVAVPTITVEPSFQLPNPIMVGDLIGFKLILDQEGAQLKAPEDLKELSKEGWTLAGAEGTEYKLIPLKAGQLETPKLDVVDEFGKKIGETEAKVIAIKSSLETDDLGKKALDRMRPPVGLPVPWTAIVILSGIVLVLLALIIWALVRWSRKRRSIVSSVPVSPPVPEDALAMRDLAELEGMNWPSRGEFKKHYFGVSEILKRYLGARFSFEASESTTEELFIKLKECRAAGVTDSVLDSLDELFAKLDRVKFTDHRPPDSEAKEVLETARKLVSMTRRVVSDEGATSRAV